MSELQKMVSGQAVLEARDLRKDFPLHQGRRVVQALESASLTLSAGRALALVGESGSGKTTLARILAGIHTPTRGELLFKGRPVNIKNARELKQYLHNVQYIFQDPFSSLNPVHTVRHHLSRPLALHGQARAAGELDVRGLLEKVNLAPVGQFLDKYPHQLSGGQRQRVSIARALAVQPVVVLADEPVSMLDVSLRLDILNLLLRLKEEDGLALLFITHDIASARYFAEEAQVMYAGQVVEGGPAEQVIRQPKHPYTRLLCAAAPNPARAASGPGDGGVAERVEPPDLVHPPAGCRFYPRCPAAMQICRQRLPPRTSFGDGHWARCFLYTRGEDASCL
jgi:peptide/nickel transport system ATP-binding protein